MFVQRPSQRVSAELVQLLHGADVFPLLLARWICGCDKFRQRFHQIHFRGLFQRDWNKRCHFGPSKRYIQSEKQRRLRATDTNNSERPTSWILTGNVKLRHGKRPGAPRRSSIALMKNDGTARKLALSSHGHSHNAGHRARVIHPGGPRAKHSLWAPINPSFFFIFVLMLHIFLCQNIIWTLVCCEVIWLTKIWFQRTILQFYRLIHLITQIHKKNKKTKKHYNIGL